MNQFTCPDCGHVLMVQSVGKGPIRKPLERQDWQEFYYSPGVEEAPTLAGASFSRRQPARAASVESDVTVPLFQAMICGAIVGILTLMGSIPLAIKNEWRWWVPPAATAGMATVSWAVAWFVLLGAHRKLLWLVEEIIGQDLDEDGEVGDPSEVHVWVTEPDKKQACKVVLPLDEGTLRQVAKAHLGAGKPLSRRGLAGVLSDGKFRKLQEILLEKGWAIYKGEGPNAGIELTKAGMAVFRHFSDN